MDALVNTTEQSGERSARSHKVLDRVPLISKTHILPMPHGSVLEVAFRAHQVIASCLAFRGGTAYSNTNDLPWGSQEKQNLDSSACWEAWKGGTSWSGLQPM